MRKNGAAFLLTLAVLSGCSQPITDELKIELTIDGKEKIKETATNEKVETLQKKHSELLDAANWACKFSEYLSSTIKDGSSVAASKTESTSAAEPDKNAILVSTELQLRPLEIPNQIFVCSSQKMDCNIKDNDGSDKQIQYPLVLASLLRTQFGMKQGATLQTQYTDRSKQNEFTLKQTVSISGDLLSCTSSFVEK